MATIAQPTALLSTTKPNRVAEAVPIADLPVITNVWVDDTRVHLDLEYGRSIAWPFAWSSVLAKATPEQRQHFSYSAYHIFWDDIDEIIGIKNVLYPLVQRAE
ncbi:DUF2442 domain-containing protein [Spirosoma gilvum]